MASNVMGELPIDFRVRSAPCRDAPKAQSREKRRLSTLAQVQLDNGGDEHVVCSQRHVSCLGPRLDSRMSRPKLQSLVKLPLRLEQSASSSRAPTASVPEELQETRSSESWGPLPLP